jgi:anti-sigma regulatory factor (Ser/Thr protein kinase)
MDTLTLPARQDSLETFLTFVLERAMRAGASEPLIYDIRLVLEEILTNIFSYAYPGGEGSVQLNFSAQVEGKLCIRVIDWGIFFDPLTANTPDIKKDFSEREIGGMGIYLARKVAHEMVYERTGDTNHLTVFFRLG